MTAASNRSHSDDPTTDPHTLRGILSTIVATLRGVGRVRPQENADRRTLAAAPVASVPEPAPKQVPSAADEQTDWPTWRNPS